MVVPSNIIPLRKRFRSRADEALLKMVNDCSAIGAQEVFVGYPEQDTYQCVAKGEFYSGYLPPHSLETLAELTKLRSPVSLDWCDASVSDLRLGISKRGSSPIYCLSWSRNDSRVITEVAEPGEKVPALRRSILFVDDDRRFSRIIGNILEGKGYDVVCVSNGSEALVRIQEREFNLIIVDLEMPHLSGPEFVLRAKRQGCTTPFVILTNSECRNIEAEMILLGASAFIRKSDDLSILLAWCQRLAA